LLLLDQSEKCNKNCHLSFWLKENYGRRGFPFNTSPVYVSILCK
jgi:hypothetical protein